MIETVPAVRAPGDDRDTACGGEDVVEISLLLPGWQVEALASTAHDCGLTAASMVRHLVRDFLAEQRSRR